MSKPTTASHSNADLKKSALSLLAATRHITEHKVSEARDKLSEIIESIGDGVEEVEEAAVKTVKEARNFVRQHPYQSAGIALGICTLLGFLFIPRKK